jgi:hypothetical protein
MTKVSNHAANLLLTPWGVLDMLNAAKLAKKEVYNKDINPIHSRAETWSSFEANMLALEKNGLIVYQAKYPNGMAVRITEKGQNALTPTWKTRLNDSFKRVVNKRVAPQNVPFQSIHVSPELIDAATLELINSALIEQGDLTDSSLTKNLSTAWSKAQKVTADCKPSLVGWRYRGDAYLAVQAGTRLVRLDADLLSSVWKNHNPSVSIAA